MRPGCEWEAQVGPTPASGPKEVHGRRQELGTRGPSKAIGAIGSCFLVPGLLARFLQSPHMVSEPPCPYLLKVGWPPDPPELAVLCAYHPGSPPWMAVAILIVSGFALRFALQRCGL